MKKEWNGEGRRRKPLITKSEIKNLEVLDGIVERESQTLPADVLAKTKQFLINEHQYTVDEIESSKLWAAVGLNPGRKLIVSADAQYASAMSYALALHELATTNTGCWLLYHILDIKKLSQQPITAKFDLNRAILLAALDYGVDLSVTTETLNEEQKKARRKALQRSSRNARAMKYLQEKGVRSYEVSGYPGGVDIWSRLASRNATGKPKERSDRASSQARRHDEARKTDGDADVRAKALLEKGVVKYCVQSLGLKHKHVMLLVVQGDKFDELGGHVMEAEDLGVATVNHMWIHDDFDRIVQVARRFICETVPTNVD